MISRFSILAFLFLFSSNLANSQHVVSIDYLLEMEPEITEEYDVDNLDSTCVLIPFDFAGNNSFTQEVIDSMLSLSIPITKIDFVYTRFAVAEDFDQHKLNEKRLNFLEKVRPSIFDNNVIEWKFYEQSNTLSHEENQELFHGFVFHFLTAKTYFGNDPERTAFEIDFLRRGCLEMPYRLTVDSTIVRKRSGGGFIPILKKKQEKGIRYPKKSIWGRKWDAYVYDTTYSYDTVYPRWTSRTIVDTVVLKTFNNYSEQMKDVLVIEDVTGSMYPYVAQTFEWRRKKLAETDLRHFVFFNDGDSRPDGPIGKSGGAYYIESDSIEEVEEFVYSVMQKGGGGYAPENNLEATIYGQKKFSDCSSYVLIADNYAAVRDMTLLGKIKKPTRIILCGARSGRIHHTYVSIAMATGGSLHTIQEDVDGIAELKVGETVEIGDQKFKYTLEGRLILVH